MGRQCDQEALFFFTELADIPTLDDQYPYHLARVYQWHAAEAVKALFSRFGDIVVSGVGLCTGQVDRVATGCHQAHQALARRDADPAHRCGSEAVGRQQEHLIAVIGQVKAAYIHCHAGADRLHDQVDLVYGLVCQRDSLDDAGQFVNYTCHSFARGILNKKRGLAPPANVYMINVLKAQGKFGCFAGATVLAQDSLYCFSTP